MSRPPITIDGPHRSRRAAKRARWAAVALTGLLLAVPFFASGIAALLEG